MRTPVGPSAGTTCPSSFPTTLSRQDRLLRDEIRQGQIENYSRARRVQCHHERDTSLSAAALRPLGSISVSIKIRSDSLDMSRTEEKCVAFEESAMTLWRRQPRLNDLITDSGSNLRHNKLDLARRHAVRSFRRRLTPRSASNDRCRWLNSRTTIFSPVGMFRNSIRR